MAAQLRANLGELLFALAYNGFCAPTLEESVEDLIKKGATHITVTTTMFTPGGSHSEVEIPEILELSPCCAAGRACTGARGRHSSHPFPPAVTSGSTTAPHRWSLPRGVYGRTATARGP